MEKLFASKESDEIKRRLNETDPKKPKGKLFTIEFITEKDPVILNAANKDKIVQTFIPEIQDLVGERFSLSFLRNDDDPQANRSYVKVYLEDKNASFINSGLTAPFFELSESPLEDKLEGKVKTSGTTSSEVIKLSDPQNIDSSFKELFEEFLNKYEKEHNK